MTEGVPAPVCVCVDKHGSALPILDRRVDRGSQPSESVNEREHHSPGECEDRDNSHSETRENGPSTEPELGTGEPKPDTVADIPDDSQMNPQECLERWKVVARLRLKESVVKEYSNRIDRFNRIVNLERYNRREFKAKVHDILVDFFSKTPKGSWRYENPKLAGYFRDGLMLEWPEKEVLRIQGTLPRVNQGCVPPIPEVLKWIGAVLAETDVYRKLLVSTIVGFGWRPEHLYKLLMADLRYDEKGEPYAIVADGEERSFKKYIDLATYLPPWYRECLKAYLTVRGSTKPSEPIFCYSDRNGQLHSDRPLDDKCLDRTWRDFIRDHNRLRKEPEKLSRLLRVDFRHWVASAQEDLGLSFSASAYMVGHSQKKTQPTYRSYYAHKTVEVALEEQEQKIPEGLILRFASPSIELAEDRNEAWFNEWVMLGRRFFAKEIGEIELATEVGRIRLRHAEGVFTPNA